MSTTKKFVLGAPLRGGDPGHSGLNNNGGCRLAFSQRTGQAYCAKLIPFLSSDDRERYAKTALDELRAIRHPNLQRIRDIYTAEPVAVVAVSELFLAPSLRQWLSARTHSISESKTRRWTQQVACALAHLHSFGLLHTNLHSDNVHIVRNDVIKVGDFLGMTTPSKLARRPTISPHNLCPEVCCGKSFNPSSDVWCLGTVMYEMVHLVHGGLFVLTDLGPKPLLVKMLWGQSNHDDLRPYYSAELLDTLARALCRDPKQRISLHKLCALTPAPPNHHMVAQELLAQEHQKELKRVIRSEFHDVERQRMRLEHELGVGQLKEACRIISTICDDTSETLIVNKLEQIISPDVLTRHLPALLEFVLCEQTRYQHVA